MADRRVCLIDGIHDGDQLVCQPCKDRADACILHLRHEGSACLHVRSALIRGCPACEAAGLVALHCALTTASSNRLNLRWPFRVSNVGPQNRLWPSQ